jgi:hypothetical protein
MLLAGAGVAGCVRHLSVQGRLGRARSHAPSEAIRHDRSEPVSLNVHYCALLSLTTTASKKNFMRVVPLFETLNDLNNAPDIITTLFSVPNYIGAWLDCESGLPDC